MASRISNNHVASGCRSRAESLSRSQTGPLRTATRNGRAEVKHLALRGLLAFAIGYGLMMALPIIVFLRTGKVLEW